MWFFFWNIWFYGKKNYIDKGDNYVSGIKLWNFVLKNWRIDKYNINKIIYYDKIYGIVFCIKIDRLI